MSKILLPLLAFILITSCEGTLPCGNSEEPQDPPPPPSIKVVKEQTKTVQLKSLIHCWNEPCTEIHRILDPKQSPLTRAKPRSDIRISFPSGREPDDITLIQRIPHHVSIRTAEGVNVLELSGPVEPGTYFFELHASWSKKKESGKIIYSFRLKVE
ncbi:hypothetical protein [Paludifilum halophilum]|uniref:Lipoprotein n=1 Tax=Paludifilum halophilum TaxID=1642702 RepID=A0A235B4B6_9BACL|nr:hypothetical protein [Paludifilum halophilum]OYD07148.1 hypothetical protein CHM34_12185 [Paludifilum halophilum]